MVRGCSKRALVLMWIASCSSRSTDAFQSPVKTPQLYVPRILQVASVDIFTHHHQYSNSTSLLIDEKDIQSSANQYLQSSTTTTATLQPGSLNSLEQWCLQRLEAWYIMSQRVRCPFFRRRYGDALDHVEWVWRHVVVRPKFRDALGPPQSRLPVDNGFKAEHLSIPTIIAILRNDWQGTRGGSRSNSNSSKGYYVTGKLSTQIYRDDCLFTSPDPDLPIHGLRKYMGVASHLFDSKTSSSKLLSLNVLDDEEEDSQIRIQATWRMHLRLRLPWKPQLPPLKGSTTYHLDESHLIHHHAETWDMDVSEAFWAMFIPHKIVQQQLNDGDALTTPSMARSTGTCPFAKLFRNNKKQ